MYRGPSAYVFARPYMDQRWLASRRLDVHGVRIEPLWRGASYLLVALHRTNVRAGATERRVSADGWSGARSDDGGGMRVCRLHVARLRVCACLS